MVINHLKLGILVCHMLSVNFGAKRISYFQQDSCFAEKIRLMLIIHKLYLTRSYCMNHTNPTLARSIASFWHDEFDVDNCMKQNFLHLYRNFLSDFSFHASKNFSKKNDVMTPPPSPPRSIVIQSFCARSREKNRRFLHHR